MESNSSISSWDNTRVSPPSDWEFESINQISHAESVGEATAILNNWSAGASLKKAKIGPKNPKSEPMLSIREKHKQRVSQHQFSRVIDSHVGGIEITNVSCAGTQSCKDICNLF